MAEFRILIEETLCDAFTIEADTEFDALEIARRRYRSGELVLEPGEVTGVRMSVVRSDGECGNWFDV